MRIIPRLYIPGTRQFSRRLRRARRHLTITRVMLLLELLFLCGVLLLVFKDGHAALLEKLRQHAGLLTLVALVAISGLLHLIIMRRLIRLIERRFSPAAYDEHRILFDFGQEVRTAKNVDELFASIVWRIGEPLETESVSIFIRTDDAGDFVCRSHIGLNLNDSAPKLVLARNAFVIKRLRRLTTPLVIEPEELDAWRRAFESELRDERETRELELDTLMRIKASLLLPIKIKEQLVGLVSLGPRRARHKYSLKDKEMLMSMASQLALIIENSKLAERMVLEEHLRHELELAAEVQQGLLPSEPPASEHLELAGFCRAARGVGGDYYDFLVLSGGQLGVAIADVSGKGISAALVMANFQAALRSHTLASPNTSLTRLSELVVSINHLLCSSTGEATYVTFFYAQFDERTKQLTYVNAGHNPPLLYCAANQGRAEKLTNHRIQDVASDYFQAKNILSRPEELLDEVPAIQDFPTKIRGVEDVRVRDWQMLETGGTVVGLFKLSRYEQETIQLQSGDILIAYTDGVTEALNPSGEEFGEDRLKDVIARTAHLGADDIRNFLVREVEEWCVGVSQYDDLTFIVLKVS